MKILRISFSVSFKTHLRVLLKELMTTSESKDNNRNSSYIHIYIFILYLLTKPVLWVPHVSSLIEDDIEDEHENNHAVEGSQSSHGRKSAIVVNNHEGEEYENSRQKIHRHLQHQDNDVKNGQSFLLVLVPDENYKDFTFLEHRT